MDETAIQCGFCIPGFIMTAVEILESDKLYSDKQLRKLLSGHLCRCTGYENIFRAVKKTMYRRHGLEWDGTFDEEQYNNGTVPTNPYF